LGSWDAEHEIPKGGVNKVKSNRIFFAKGPDPNPKTTFPPSQDKNLWKATEDLPFGMVKGMSDLYGRTNVKKPDGPPSNHMQPLDSRAYDPL
jgi:hypothetical protein